MTRARGAKLVFFICLFLLSAGAFLPALFVTIKSLNSVADTSALYRILLPGSHQWSLLKSTIIILLGTSVGAIILGVPLALVFSRTRFPGRTFFLFLCPIPLLLPSYVHTICWTYLLDTFKWVPKFNDIAIPYLDISYGHLASIWVLILSYYPVVTFFSFVSFNQIDSNLEHAARIHAGGFRVLKNITLKLASPGILSGGLFVMIFALSNFSVPSMLGVNVFSLDVFYQFSSLHRMDQAAISVIPLLFFSMIALFCIHRLDKSPRSVVIDSSIKFSFSISPIKKWLISGCVLFIYILSIFLPLIILLNMAGPWENYIAAISNARHDILISFWTAVGAATFAFIISVILAYIAWNTYPKMGNWIDLIAIISFTFPAVGIAIGIIELWNREGVTGYVYASSFILVIAYFCRYISFAFKPVRIAMNYVDISMEENAQIIGIPWWQRLVRLLAPLSSKGLMISWFMVYLFSLTDLSMAILVHPPGKGTIPIRIYNMLHFGRQEWVGALCLVLAGLVLLPYIILILWSVKKPREAYS